MHAICSEQLMSKCGERRNNRVSSEETARNALCASYFGIGARNLGVSACVSFADRGGSSEGLIRAIMTGEAQ